MNYAKSGLDIQGAMVDLARKYPDKKARPAFLQWNEFRVQTSDRISLPSRGRLAAKFLRCDKACRQGFDLKFSDGFVYLLNGQKLQHLRTWFDEQLPPEVEYEFATSDGILQFWNVYERKWPDGRVTEERMTGNAGFWIEEVSGSHRIYHCSSGERLRPEFDAMVIELRLFSI